MLEVLWDFVFPKRCIGCKKLGAYICDDCFAKISFAQKYFCGVCGHPSYNGLTHPKCRTRYAIDGIFPILNYHGLLKKILYQYKYNPHLSDVTSTLGDLLYEGIIQNEIIMREIEEEHFIILPVPLYKGRKKVRGYNQSELLSNYLIAKLNTKNVGTVLVRSKNTIPQFRLAKDVRKQNVKGAFEVVDSKKVYNKTVLLIDDITTTGSTLSECARMLKRGGAKRVYGIALGHEEK